MMYRSAQVQSWPNRALRDAPQEWTHECCVEYVDVFDVDIRIPTGPANETPASRGEMRRNWPSWFAPDVRRFWRINSVTFPRGRWT